ncbi:MAG: histidinol-phosphate transaminase [Bacteroidales bacterium]|nr:histidinol-phosphate transaminase [Bacteroidales bacterium]MBN2764256.1 histidinol-phosphate transaminase [Bacteroidales bacterium]
MTDLNQLLRKNIKNLIPYSSARNEYQGEASVFLDANENPFNEPFNRYPDPLQVQLKKVIARIKNVKPEMIFLGNGSDEAIDLIVRAFCEPGTDNIVAVDPTYGMYKVCADINNVEYRKVLLTPSFEPDVDALMQKTDHHTKIIFLCSPNNPTSNSFSAERIINILKAFDGIVVLDEAYIDFSSGKGFLPSLHEYHNLVILQTFSKAWGMAGIRLGMAFADPGIIAVLSKIKYPYNINILTLKTALESLKDTSGKEKWVSSIIQQRDVLEKELKSVPFVLHVFPSDANFLLIKVNRPRELYQFLVSKRIIIRDRSSVSLCEGCLRITIGTAAENRKLTEALKTYQETKL